MFNSFLVLAIALTAAIAAPSILPTSAPDPSQVTIQSISYGGSGCPQNSVGEFLSADRSTFTLMFDGFAAQIGPTTQPSDARKYCQINLDLQYPAGFQFSVLSTTFRGYAALQTGVNATLSALYYFSGPNQASVRTSTVFQGPNTLNYDVPSDVGFTSVVWSPCGANWPLNLGTSVAVESVDPTKDSGFIENDTVDGNIQFVTGIQWRSCS